MAVCEHVAYLGFNLTPHVAMYTILSISLQSYAVLVIETTKRVECAQIGCLHFAYKSYFILYKLANNNLITYNNGLFLIYLGLLTKSCRLEKLIARILQLLLLFL